MIGVKSVVIIEDDTTVSDIYEKYLREKYGLEVFTETDGKRGFDMCRQLYPDLMIIDLMLPSISGFELINLVRNNEKMKQIPIIVVSAHHSKAHVTEAIKLGANGFLAKPGSFVLLDKKLRELGIV